MQLHTVTHKYTEQHIVTHSYTYLDAARYNDAHLHTTTQSYTAT